MTRLEALTAALKWQGGTIHQVAEATGCKPADLLHTEPERGWHRTAWFMGRMSGEHAVTRGTHRFLDPETGKAFPHTYGLLPYWLGVIDGVRTARTGWWPFSGREPDAPAGEMSTQIQGGRA